MAETAGQSQTINGQSHSGIPRRDELLALFRERRRTDNDYKPSAEQLVDLLGGIDAVMDTVLTASHHNLAPDDCVTMKQQFVEPLLSSKTNDRLTFTLDPNNNMLHQISPFIHRHLFTKRVVFSMIALFVLLTVLGPGTFSFTNSAFYDKFYKVLISAYFWLCLYPFFGAAVLKVNKSMFKMILESADFWILVGSAVSGQMYVGMYRYLDLNASDSLLLDIVYFIHTLIAIVLFYTFIGLFDGLHGINQKVKIIILIIMAVMTLISAFQWKYVIEEQVVDIDKLGEYGRINVNGNVAGSEWVTFLFLFKMALKTKWKGAGRCVLVKHSPSVEGKEPATQPANDMENAESAENEPEPSTDNVEVVTTISQAVIPQTAKPEPPESAEDVPLDEDNGPEVMRIQSITF